MEALDAKTGNVLWKFPLTRISLSSGVLATRGGVVFASAAEGEIIALDAKSGKLLWHTKLSSSIIASPISYSVAGKQFIAVVADNMVHSFSLAD